LRRAKPMRGAHPQRIRRPIRARGLDPRSGEAVCSLVNPENRLPVVAERDRSVCPPNKNPARSCSMNTGPRGFGESFFFP
jgi:hypothetical protein